MKYEHVKMFNVIKHVCNILYVLTIMYLWLGLLLKNRILAVNVMILITSCLVLWEMCI